MMKLDRRMLMTGLAGSMVPCLGPGLGQAMAGPGDLLGAGGNTIRPIMTGWVEALPKPLGLNVTYEAIGSPAGTSKILAGITDFAILEIPLLDAQLEQSALYQFPLAFGAIVFVANVPGIENNQLALRAQTLGGIYSGAIKKWNDPKIVADNPGVSLPDLEVRPFYHGDVKGAIYGDTIAITSFLLAANVDWRERFGTTIPRRWTVAAMSATGDTMTNTIKGIEGAIGYLPLGAATSAKLPIVLKRDDKGKTVTPGADSLKAAVAAIDWAKSPNMVGKMVDLPGDGVWPIVIASYGVVPRDLKKKANGAALHTFFKFILNEGAEISRKRGGEPLPTEIRTRVLGQLDKFLV